MKKFWIIISILFLFLAWNPANVCADELADEERRDGEAAVYFFWGENCPHCAEEKEFLDELEIKYPNLEVKSYEVYNDRDNYRLYQKISEKYGINSGSIPVIFIGNFEPIVGYRDNLTTGKEIESNIKVCLEAGCISPEEKIREDDMIREEKNSESLAGEETEIIDLPVFGEVNVSETGLLIFSVMVGILDGFNACAMWSLCFLLTFLAASGTRKRLFLIGGTYILVSGIVYFIFISAWMNLFRFVGYLPTIRIVLGVLAIIFGLISIKDYFAFGKGISFILPEKTRDKIVDKMKYLTKPGLALSIVIAGVALLAAGVNLIELLCTTGFPAIYTKILTAHDLPLYKNYFYIFIYVLFYMLDDLLIFTIAIVTLSSKKFEKKYARVSKLISGIIILILGLIMIFKPGLLMLG